MRKTASKYPRKEEYRSLNINRILLEITNIDGFEAESEFTWRKFLNKIDCGNARTKLASKESKMERKEQGFRYQSTGINFQSLMNSYKNILANDNVVIIEKTPSTIRTTKDQGPRNKQQQQNSDITTKKKSISKHEMPQPNTVQRFKDIFEALSLELQLKDLSPTAPGATETLGRSNSMYVSNNKWPQINNNIFKEKADFSKSIQTESTQVEDTDSILNETEIPESPLFSSEDEEQREWRNACSPVTPEVIQKIREYGTSMTFFGRPAYSICDSSTLITTSLPDYGATWPKPKIVDMTLKYSDHRSVSSLGSSISSGDEENILQNFKNNESLSNDRDDYYSIINLENDSRSTSPEDSYSYDIVYLSENYSRISTPKLGLLHKGVWLKDPYWHGSSYIIYDFRGTDVKHHIDDKLIQMR